MMKDQRKIFRDQMAYLHRKTLERVGTDTKAMANVMRETLDKAEKELITLKLENKSLILKHTLLSTEYAVMQAKYSSHGNESGDPLAQCQRDLVDWQNRYTAKDNEAKMLATQLGVLTNVIQTQGLSLISSAPAPVPAPAPAPAPAPTHIAPSVINEEINLNGWDFGGTRQPAWGNTRHAAVNREPVYNDGWGPTPSSANTNESSHVHSENDPQRMDYVAHYGRHNTKGQPNKGKGKYKSSYHGSGKRGRDPDDPS